MYSLTIILTFYVSNAISLPIIIKSNIHRDYNQEEVSNNLNNQNNLRISNFLADEAFNTNAKLNVIQAADIGKYHKSDEILKKNSIQGFKDEDNFHHNEGDASSDFLKDASHKKGHQKSGFHNTYHKDESGSSSSYFDDSNDEGGEFARKKNRNLYGGGGAQNNRESYLDRNGFDKNNLNEGNYNIRGLHRDNSGNDGRYKNVEYINNERDLRNYNYGDGRNDFRRHNQEYTPTYYPDQRKIQVYEDPSYIFPGYERRNEYGIEILPPPRENYDNKYTNTRPLNDYYYY